MPIKKQMHRFVPFAIELFIGMRVPPILVKLTTVQSTQLCEKVAHILEYDLKDQQQKNRTG